MVFDLARGNRDKSKGQLAKRKRFRDSLPPKLNDIALIFNKGPSQDLCKERAPRLRDVRLRSYDAKVAFDFPFRL